MTQPGEDAPAEQEGEAEHRDEPRRYPSTLGGAFYLGVLILVTTGLAFAVAGRWRSGIGWVGGAMILGALVRLVLRERDAGMLAVRNRYFDSGLLAALGAALCFLAATIPDRVV